MAKLGRNTSFCFENYLKEVKMSKGVSALLFFIGSLCLSFYMVASPFTSGNAMTFDARIMAERLYVRVTEIKVR